MQWVAPAVEVVECGGAKPAAHGAAATVLRHTVLVLRNCYETNQPTSNAGRSLLPAKLIDTPVQCAMCNVLDKLKDVPVHAQRAMCHVQCAMCWPN